MDAVRTSLIARGSKALLLLSPPFDRSAQEPGYIKGYPPGVRENGGQYTHAAAWIVMAMAALGSGDEAAELFHMLNPVNHTRTPEEVARYRIEPYVVAGDVYARAPHAGRGGWSWYTGSAGWMYQLIMESFIGLKRQADTLKFTPCVPAEWENFEVNYRFADSNYHIQFIQSPSEMEKTMRIFLDGIVQENGAIPLINDGKTHEVKIELFTALPGLVQTESLQDNR